MKVKYLIEDLITNKKVHDIKLTDYSITSLVDGYYDYEVEITFNRNTIELMHCT